MPQAMPSPRAGDQGPAEHRGRLGRVKADAQTKVIQGVPMRTGGDIVTQVGGQPLTSMQRLAAAIALKQPVTR